MPIRHLVVCVHSISASPTSTVWEVFAEVLRWGNASESTTACAKVGRWVSSQSGQASANSHSPHCRGFQSPCPECTEVKKSALVPSMARSSPMRECSRSSSYASTHSSSHSSRSPNPRASPRYTRSRSTSSGKR